MVEDEREKGQALAPGSSVLEGMEWVEALFFEGWEVSLRQVLLA